ncbi:MAG: bifunctional phosphopantothenoylcysteine decarboxylase/phosphopantothenate--cysteine ligase CoaBC [Candidatus Woesearchaeota archaeon]
MNNSKIENKNTIKENTDKINANKNIDLQVDNIDNYLEGKNIALAITGGIAAIETPKIARHLRRYGANVTAYMTPESHKFIGKASLEWATEKRVVDELSGLAEHICREDLVLIAPATANTISKITNGIADNTVTTLTASALGQKKPVMVAPCMHDSLYNNPFFIKNINELSQHVDIIAPRFEEGKAKIAGLETIVGQVIRKLSQDPIKGKKILITAGPTPVPIDSVRYITNRFKGSIGIMIASELYLRGADVKLLLGNESIKVPSYLDVLIHKDYDSYYKNVFEELKKGYDIGIFSAAVADYKPTTIFDGKIASGGKLNLDLVPTKKVIDEVRDKYPQLYMTTFKYTIGKS